MKRIMTLLLSLAALAAASPALAQHDGYGDHHRGEYGEGYRHRHDRDWRGDEWRYHHRHHHDRYCFYRHHRRFCEWR